MSNLRRLGVPIRGHFRQLVQPGWTPDYRGDLVGAEQAPRDGNEISRADAVVLIGGEGATRDIFDACIQRQKAVLPIAGSGGDSAAAFELVASGQQKSVVDRRLLRYLALGETADAMINRTAVVLRVLHNEPSAEIYRRWASAVLDLLSGNSPASADYPEAPYFKELWEASWTDVSPPLRFMTEPMALGSSAIPARTRAPLLKTLLPEAVEWLRFDFTQLTNNLPDIVSWRALAFLTPLVIKHLPKEAQGLIRAVCFAAGSRDSGELLQASPPPLEPAELDLVLRQAFDLSAGEFGLLLRLWRFAQYPEDDPQAGWIRYAPLAEMLAGDDAPALDMQVIALLVNKDRLNRHLAFGAFLAVPVHGAANAVAQALALETAEPQGLSPLWAQCVSKGLDLDPLDYLNHPIIDKAIREAASYVSSNRDPSGGWNALLQLAGDLHPSAPPKDRPLTHVHVLAFAFVLRHILTGDEWRILSDLSDGQRIEIPAGSEFRATIRRIRDRGIIQGGRVSALERGKDLGDAFQLTQNGRLLLEARTQGAAAGWMGALLVFNLITTAERTHLRKLAGDGSPNFSRSDSLIDELRRLRARGLILNSGSSIGGLPMYGDYSKVLYPTPDGREYLDLCRQYGVLTEPPSHDGPEEVSAECVEFLFEHLLTGPQKLHLDRMAPEGPAKYEFHDTLLKELRWLRSLELISSRGPLHNMPRQGDLKSVAILTPEGRTYLDLKRDLASNASGYSGAVAEEPMA